MYVISEWRSSSNMNDQCFLHGLNELTQNPMAPDRHFPPDCVFHLNNYADREQFLLFKSIMYEQTRPLISKAMAC